MNSDGEVISSPSPTTPTTPRNAYFSLAPLGKRPVRQRSVRFSPSSSPTSPTSPTLHSYGTPWTAAAYSPSPSPSASSSGSGSPSPDGSPDCVFRFSTQPTSSRDVLKWAASIVSDARYKKYVPRMDNWSSCWADGLAFCAIIHRFFPDAFDYDALDPRDRKRNLGLGFRTAEERARIAQLLDVKDMLEMGDHPDSKCVYTYVQSMYRRLRKYSNDVSNGDDGIKCHISCT